MWKMNKFMSVTVISFVILCNIYQIKSQTLNSVLSLGSRQPGDQFLFIVHNHTQLTTPDDYLTFVNTGVNTTMVEYVIRPFLGTSSHTIIQDGNEPGTIIRRTIFTNPQASTLWGDARFYGFP